MDRQFPQVGRLQSTRGFSLTGRPYVFETPIAVKGKRSAFKKKRAKGGKIIYDNPRARYHRNINLQGTNPKLRRNTPNVGANNNFGGGLSRGGYGDFTANSLERLQDRRIEAEANRIEQLVEKEIKKAACYKNNKPHKDDLGWDLAGLIYFNSGSLKDGTYIYNSEYDFDPSIIIGSKMNRCTYYDTQVWHSPGMEQEIEERWVQPFFIVHKKETLEKINET